MSRGSLSKFTRYSTGSSAGNRGTDRSDETGEALSATPARFGGSDLSDEDLIQLNSTLLALVRVRENQWLQHQNGVIDERTWLTYRTALTAVFSTEFTRSWFRNRAERGEFDPDFVDMVNELFSNSPPQSGLSVREALGFDPE